MTLIFMETGNKNGANDSLSVSEKIMRILWEIVKPFFYHSPRPFFGLRNWILRLFGAKIGKNVHIYPRVNIKLPWNLTIGNNVGVGEDTLLYSWAMITIEDDAIVSHKCQLCSGSHDCFDPEFPVILSPIIVKKGVWICTQVFIGPGVKLGEYAVVSSGAVLMRNAKSWGIYVGNPASKVGDRSFN